MKTITTISASNKKMIKMIAIADRAPVLPSSNVLKIAKEKTND